MTNDDKEINDEISWQNYKMMIELTQMIRQYDENKLLFLGHL